ncbi:hypothetical protein [Stutzerimonas stutzeri]|nr:hypothetical protein [Stutzerimonas stutzeri]
MAIIATTNAQVFHRRQLLIQRLPHEIATDIFCHPLRFQISRTKP